MTCLTLNRRLILHALPSTQVMSNGPCPIQGTELYALKLGGLLVIFSPATPKTSCACVHPRISSPYILHQKLLAFALNPQPHPQTSVSSSVARRRCPPKISGQFRVKGLREASFRSGGSVDGLGCRV